MRWQLDWHRWSCTVSIHLCLAMNAIDDFWNRCYYRWTLSRSSVKWIRRHSVAVALSEFSGKRVQHSTVVGDGQWHEMRLVVLLWVLFHWQSTGLDPSFQPFCRVSLLTSNGCLSRLLQFISSMFDLWAWHGQLMLMTLLLAIRCISGYEGICSRCHWLP